MKFNIVWIALIWLALTFFVSAQDKGLEINDGGKKSESAESVNSLFLAYQAAKYGRANKSPDALIFAAAVLKTIVSDKVMLDKKVEGGQPDLVNKETKPNLTADAFLKDAKFFAKKDRNLLGRINAVSVMTPKVRGASGGPKRATTEVKAYATDVISVQFRGGENAVVAISGDGDTDLDLYVYDETGNLIAADTSGSDDCKVRFLPKSKGTFRIKVKNLGNVYNRYLLVTN